MYHDLGTCNDEGARGMAGTTQSHYGTEAAGMASNVDRSLGVRLTAGEEDATIRVLPDSLNAAPPKPPRFSKELRNAERPNPQRSRHARLRPGDRRTGNEQEKPDWNFRQHQLSSISTAASIGSLCETVRRSGSL